MVCSKRQFRLFINLCSILILFNIGLIFLVKVGFSHLKITVCYSQLIVASFDFCAFVILKFYSSTTGLIGNVTETSTIDYFTAKVCEYLS